ncbi:uncharacterized protein LTR77_010620 [Saxophila tyrrhenica]|uniref:Mannan endo-1,6-alpha-mannosidase n=1 Tax=Saxophila tyrrhenica TaxID=1690608 RepID=A0AAV9NXD7_9PEZI|nr:hypothetical protein LTR77_010620 [Saxophila tyrrhenica]
MRLSWTALASLAIGGVGAVELDIDSADSIKEASSTIAYDMMSFYTGNNTGDNPGNLPQPYYWWEAGAMFMHMVDYYYYTGDPTYNPTTIQAITWQAGDTGEFMPQNQTKDEGNDDQVFWAFAAMAAAELEFPPPTQGYPSWTAMAQAVFNLQAERWDPDNCGGGLRWQIQPLNAGYDYKNIASNGGFFQLAARLARYTDNSTYVDWTEKMWNWISNSTLYEPGTAVGTKIYDGAQIEAQCSKPNPAQYSYNYGILIGGLAYIYNHTEEDKWLEPIYGILNGTFNIFFHDSSQVIQEVGCEPHNSCDTDGLTFKSFTLRWLALCAQLVPQTAEQIWPYIDASAQGAAGQCSGSNDECGYHWLETTWDGSTGVGQQMSALAAVQAPMLQVKDLKAPLTLKTGATSKGDASAGTGGDTDTSGDSGSEWLTKRITTGDKAGAGILTALLLIATLGGTYWLVSY